MRRPANYKDIIGQKFNRLLVLESINIKKWISHVRCKCDCGKIVDVKKANLTNGHTKSCGCWKSEIISKNARKRMTTHGRSKDSEYNIWNGILQRCNNPKATHYKNYGGRGISVCKSWYNFENFYKDMGDRPSKKHSIDRIDNNGNYEPLNCRWTTTLVQLANKRNNVRLNFYGTELTIAQWGRILGISHAVLSARLYKYKWSITKTLTTPVGKY